MTKTIQLIETYQFETKHFGIVRINLTTGNGLYNITIISNLIMCEKTWHKIFAGFKATLITLSLEHFITVMKLSDDTLSTNFFIEVFQPFQEILRNEELSTADVILQRIVS